MRKFFRSMSSAVLLLILSGQATWAQNQGFPGRQGPLPPGSITHSDRTVVHGDIVHYRFDVRVGPGQFDMIRLHRVVKEQMPHHPIRTVDGVLLLPGSPNFFESIFMAPLISSVPAWNRSIAIFLAENNVDVWGMDYGWALVPAETADFNFMKDWGIEKDTRHTEVALSLARQSCPARQRPPESRCRSATEAAFLTLKRAKEAGVCQEGNMRAIGGITGFRFYALRGSQDVPMSTAQAVAAYVLGHKQEAANAPLHAKIVVLSALSIGAALHGCRTEYAQAALVLLKDEEFRLPNLVKIVDGLGGREQVKAIAFGVTNPHLRAICWRGMTAVERGSKKTTVGAVAPGPRAMVGERVFQVGFGSADQRVTQLLNILSTIIKNEQDSSSIVNKQVA